MLKIKFDSWAAIVSEVVINAIYTFSKMLLKLQNTQYWVYSAENK